MALDLICLDTSAYSHFMRGVSSVVEQVRTARRVAVPAVVLGELRTGFRLGRRPHDNEAELQTFLRQPPVSVVDVDEPTSTIYADLVMFLRQQGTPVPTNDIWIAAAARRIEGTLLTLDRHFQHIPQVPVQYIEL